jgi:hypothetical protein
VQNENSKSLIKADKRIRNIFKDIDSEDMAGGCSSSQQYKKTKSLYPKAK